MQTGLRPTTNLPKSIPVRVSGDRLPTLKADGLMQAIDNFTVADKTIRFTERAAARVILDQVETFMSPSSARDQLRRDILDSLSGWRERMVADYKAVSLFAWHPTLRSS